MDSSLEFSNSLGSSLARCRTFKIIVVGDSGVGKTCLAHRFCAGEFPTRTEATIGVDFRERLVEVHGEKIKLQLWDTAGQERFRKSMIQHYYRNVHAVLFVYDVTRPASFSGLAAWIEECRQNSLGQDIPRFLVGNKSDLREHGAVRSQGQVNWEHAHTLAEAHGMTLFETSAKCPPDTARRGGGGGGGGDKKKKTTPCREDSTETIVIAVATRLAAKSKRTTASVLKPYYSGSFKLPAKKSPEKDMWACTC